MEVYGVGGDAITVAADHLRVRYHGQDTESQITASPLPNGRQDSLDYLSAVLRGQIKPDGDDSALDTNLVVMQILDAARQSAQTGRTVELKSLPH